MAVVAPANTAFHHLLGLANREVAECFRLYSAERLSEVTLHPSSAILVCGADSMPDCQREKVEALCKRVDAVVLNSPPATLSRAAQLQTLRRHGVNSFGVWNIDDGDRPDAFPVFVRSLAPPGRILSHLIGSTAAMDAWISTNPRSAGGPKRIAVEWAATRGPDDMYRKYGAFVVGDSVVLAHEYASTHWVVRSGTSARVETLGTRRRFMDVALRHRVALLHAARLCGFDYTRVDFTTCKGRLEVFECNSDPFLRTCGRTPAAVHAAGLILRAILRTARDRLRSFTPFCDDTPDR